MNLSEINYMPYDPKTSSTKNKNVNQNLSKRYCGKCKKEYSFEDAMKKYPKLIQDSIIPF